MQSENSDNDDAEYCGGELVVQYCSTYLLILCTGVGGGEENQSEGENGKYLHCCLFDAEVVCGSGEYCLRGHQTPFLFIQ